MTPLLTIGSGMSTWYVLLDGSQEDLAHVKRLFGASEFTLDRMDEKDVLTAPAFESCNDASEVIDAGTKLLSAINTTLRISLSRYAELQLHAVIEKREDGTTHRTVSLQGLAFGIASAIAIAKSGSFGEPVRSKEERLVSLMGKNEVIAELALAMAVRPLTWDAMNRTYESAKGLMSTKTGIRAKREDRQGLIDRGWLSFEESERFYHTAAYHRHGYPKSPNRATTPMEYYEASSLTDRLFWRLIDELEPR